MSKEETVYETLCVVCEGCGCDTFRIEVTGAGEIASYTDWFCSECGEQEGGFLNDPLNEVETSELGEKHEAKNREVFVMGMLGVFPEEDKIMVGVADLIPLLNQFNGKHVQIAISELGEKGDESI